VPGFESDELNRSPSAEPLTYPGRQVDGSYLLIEEWFYRMAPREGRRVGQWTLSVDGGPLSRVAISPQQRLHLNHALLYSNAAPMDWRIPVVAIGSNAAPSQILHKFSRSPRVSGVVPVTRGVVTGLTIGHSAHVSRPGYIAYVAVAFDPQVPRPLTVLWLDEHQLERTNQTEPNYELVSVDGGQYPLVLDSGEAIGQYSLYRGMYGALCRNDDQSLVEATTQASILTWLTEHAWFHKLVRAEDLGEIVELLHKDDDLRDKVREELASHGLSCNDGIVTKPVDSLPYARLIPKPDDPGAWRVRRRLSRRSIRQRR
jgi:hypothetical protein